MATSIQSSSRSVQSEVPYHTKSKIKSWAIPLGRFLFSLIFILSGINHFSSVSIDYAGNAGIPIPGILVPASGAIALIGGLSVLVGYKARFGALLLIIFLIPVTFLMHRFWTINDPQIAQMEMVHFMKNLSMLGGAILINFYGAGPISYDKYKEKLRP